METAGTRYGLSSHHPDDRFGQLEAFADLATPVRAELGRNWSLRLQIDFSVGWLEGQGDDAFVGTLGPAVRLCRKEFPVEFVGGISPTFLNEEHLGHTDFGSLVQFTSYAGVCCRLGSRLEAGYRFQHMSNANLGTHNPGLNLHMFSVGFRF